MEIQGSSSGESWIQFGNLRPWLISLHSLHLWDVTYLSLRKWQELIKKHAQSLHDLQSFQRNFIRTSIQIPIFLIQLLSIFQSTKMRNKRPQSECHIDGNLRRCSEVGSHHEQNKRQQRLPSQVPPRHPPPGEL